MAINLDKAGTIVAKAIRRDTVHEEEKYKDNIAWWMNRYERLISTEAEDAVRYAATTFNQAVALRDKAVDQLAQFDQEVDKAEREISRLGGIAFVEQLRPTIKERKAYLDNLYESLTQGRTAEWWGNP
jgi:hypothetical protein